MDWFDTIKINDDIKVTMIPAQHWSKRWIWGVGNTDRSLWGSFLIEYKGKKIFFACDTGPAPFYKDLDLYKRAQVLYHRQKISFYLCIRLKNCPKDFYLYFQLPKSNACSNVEPESL